MCVCVHMCVWLWHNPDTHPDGRRRHGDLGSHTFINGSDGHVTMWSTWMDYSKLIF